MIQSARLCEIKDRACGAKVISTIVTVHAAPIRSIKLTGVEALMLSCSPPAAASTSSPGPPLT